MTDMSAHGAVWAAAADRLAAEAAHLHQQGEWRSYECVAANVLLARFVADAYAQAARDTDPADP